MILVELGSSHGSLYEEDVLMEIFIRQTQWRRAIKVPLSLTY